MIQGQQVVQYLASFCITCSRAGGEGKVGKVTDVRGWDSESGRSVAAVSWGSGSTNVYRVGHKGKVDLKYVQAASGGFYYKDHLPVLGMYCLFISIFVL